MNDSMRNSSIHSETGDRDNNAANASMMQPLQSTVLTDLGLIYMLQQQQQQQGGEAAMMLSPGSLPLIMSSCQVMALHPGMSQQFVSASSTGTSPSPLTKSPLLAQDGSLIWHAPAVDQMSDNYNEGRNQGTSFGQQRRATNQQTLSPPAPRNAMMIQHCAEQLLAVNGFPVYTVTNANSLSSTIGLSSGFAASSTPSKLVITSPPKSNLVAPKKPLTPYMKFSKSIWQHVKNANPSKSVCEVGASIGRLWREMADVDKQKYNNEFQREKVVYEADLQTYLRATGLQVSDLVKPKKKDQRDRSRTSSNNTAAAVSNQIYTKTVTTNQTNSVGAPVHRDVDMENARLPHISQMWSAHSSVQQDVLKNVSHSFDSTRLQNNVIVTRSLQDGNSKSSYDHNITQSSPGGSTVPQAEALGAAGLQWTWLKDPEVFSRSSFVNDAVDTSQSAYIQQDEGNAAPSGMEYSLAEGLEPGEVVLGVQDQASTTLAASAKTNIISAHNLYNSYAFNPWSRYKTNAESGGRSALFDRQQTLQTELVHLHGSLTEKTQEVERLTKELDAAYALIDKLKQQELPSQTYQFQQNVHEPGIEESIDAQVQQESEDALQQQQPIPGKGEEPEDALQQQQQTQLSMAEKDEELEDALQQQQQTQQSTAEKDEELEDVLQQEQTLQSTVENKEEISIVEEFLKVPGDETKNCEEYNFSRSADVLKFLDCSKETKEECEIKENCQMELVERAFDEEDMNTAEEIQEKELVAGVLHDVQDQDDLCHPHNQDMIPTEREIASDPEKNIETEEEENEHLETSVSLEVPDNNIQLMLEQQEEEDIAIDKNVPVKEWSRQDSERHEFIDDNAEEKKFAIKQVELISKQHECDTEQQELNFEERRFTLDQNEMSLEEDATERISGETECNSEEKELISKEIECTIERQLILDEQECITGERGCAKKEQELISEQIDERYKNESVSSE